MFDGLATAARQVETEANCANDNPLIDPDSGEIFHTGNFLAQYTGVAMDQLRYHLGLLAKHVDVQIALLMTPEFSYGLSASLVGNTEAGVNVGLKSLQIGGNSMMPLIAFYGQSIVDRFPTHAEQFNQNINSQAMNSANLARETLDVLEHYLALALLCGVQAVELRAQAGRRTAMMRADLLSPATAALYEAARTAAAGPPDAGPAAPLERSRRVPPAQGRGPPRRHRNQAARPCARSATSAPAGPISEVRVTESPATERPDRAYRAFKVDTNVNNNSWTN